MLAVFQSAEERPLKLLQVDREVLSRTDAQDRKTTPIMAQESTALAAQPRWLSHGTKRFEHNGIVVYPAAVVIDEKCARLSVVVRALATDPAAPAGIDLNHARISAFVVSASTKITRQEFSIALYLRYPGSVHVAVDPDLKHTAKRIESRHEQLRRQGRVRHTADGDLIPGLILAYVLSSITNFDPTRGDLPSDGR